MSETNIYSVLEGLLDVDEMTPAESTVKSTTIRDRGNGVVGWVTPEGIIFNNLRNRCGKVDENGTVTSILTTVIGNVDDDGGIRNHIKALMGRIDEDGSIRTSG